MPNLQSIGLYNGKEVALDNLMVPYNDRAFMFGDAVYEVLRVYRQKPFLYEQHLRRLSRSLDALSMPSVPDIKIQIDTCIAVNHIEEGMVYVQISRGNIDRSHSFHGLRLKPNVLVYAKPFLAHPAEKERACGMTVITYQDMRWGRCDIKTVNLLPNCLAQSFAHKSGVDDAILIRDGLVTEACSANVFVVKNNLVKTAPLHANILPGIRRQLVIEHLRSVDIEVQEVSVEQEELYLADEVFITSTIKEAVGVVKIDNKPIGLGVVGPITKLARQAIIDAAS